MSLPIKAIVPAAGLGTRLLPATKSQPKEMLPIGRKPILQYIIEELQSAGLKQILIITGRRKRAIEDHFDLDPDLVSAFKKSCDNREVSAETYSDEGARFFYTRQSVQKGLGHAISLGVDFVNDEDFAVALGDSLISTSEPAIVLSSMVEVQQSLKSAAVIAVEKVPASDTHRYGIISTESPEPPPGEPVLLNDIVEKPEPGKAPGQFAVAARYVFTPEIFRALAEVHPDKGGEIQLTDAIRWLIRKGLPVYAWPMREGERRYDIGNFESYFKTFIDFCLADEKYGDLMKDFIAEKARELRSQENY